MKAVLIVAGVAVFVAVRRAQLGHMPHTLGELVPWLGSAAKACCAGCASSSSSCTDTPATATAYRAARDATTNAYESPAEGYTGALLEADFTSLRRPSAEEGGCS